MSLPVRIVSAVLLVSLALVACGNKQVSRQGFVDALNRTCETTNLELAGLDRPATGEEGDASPEDVAAFLAASLEINEEAADGIRAIKVSEELRPTREQLVAAMDEANAGLAAAAEAAKTSDEHAMADALARLQTGRQGFDALTATLGADLCRTP